MGTGGSTQGSQVNQRSNSHGRYITVRTQHLQGSGTDSKVHFIFFNENGDRSDIITPDKPFKNDFERGSVETYPVNMPANFGPVTKIELWCDAWLGDRWFVDYVTVGGDSRKDNSVFPIQRWIDSKHVVIHRNDSCLPQFAPNQQERRTELDLKRVLYQFSVPFDGLPSTVVKLPKSEQFSVPFEADLFKTVLKSELSRVFNSLQTCEWKNLDDVKSIYGGNLKMPINPDLWNHEWYFGAQRLMGCNPTQIRLCTELPDNLAVEENELRSLMENMSLSDVLAQKRLFIVNHKILDGIPTVDSETVICAPIALFFRTKDGTLIPVAIQLFQEKGNDNPVFLPSDSKYTWLVAKLFFNNADAQIQESVSHLFVTHIIMESFALCAHRQLSPSHPMFRLMAAHFQFLLAINSLGLPVLTDPGGWLDEVTNMGRDGALELMRRQWKEWRLDIHGTFPNELKERGVEDPNVLPNYYYRDDAFLIYNAIYDYVSKIVSDHYDDAKKLEGDDELQAWGEELATPQPLGFGIQGLPKGGRFACNDDVIKTITCVIFTCSVGHAAVNNNQYDQFASPLKYPLHLRGSPPKTKQPLTEKDVVKHLPEKSTQLRIMVKGKILSQVGTEKLGYFDNMYQSDDTSQSAIKEFREDLEKIGQTINEANKKRMVAYNYLHPSVLPNSIAI